MANFILDLPITNLIEIRSAVSGMKYADENVCFHLWIHYTNLVYRAHSKMFYLTIFDPKAL